MRRWLWVCVVAVVLGIALATVSNIVRFRGFRDKAAVNVESREER